MITEATLDTFEEGDPVVLDYGLYIPRLNITHFLGTFDYRVEENRSGMVGFRITNETTRKSGTRIPTQYGGVHPRHEAEADSIEELIERNPFMAPVPVAFIVATNRVISILRERARVESEDPLNLTGGGDMFQHFIWEEEWQFKCDPLPALVSTRLATGK